MSDITEFLAAIRDFQIIGASIGLAGGYLISRFQSRQHRLSQISKEIYLPLHSELFNIRSSLRHNHSTELMSYDSAWNKFKNQGTIALIDRELERSLQAFFDEAQKYNFKLRDTIPIVLSTITDYVKAHFVDDKAPNASTAIQQVPWSIWNAFSPDLLREPLSSYLTPEEFDRFVKDQRRQSESYGVHVPEDYLKELTELLEAKAEIRELVAVKKRLASQCEGLMQIVENKIKRHGI